MCHSKCTQCNSNSNSNSNCSSKPLWQLQWYGWQLGTHATSKIATLSNAKCSSQAVATLCHARHCHMPHGYSRIVVQANEQSAFWVPGMASSDLGFICYLFTLLARVWQSNDAVGCQYDKCQLCGSWQLMWQGFVFLSLCPMPAENKPTGILNCNCGRTGRAVYIHVVGSTKH